MTCIWHISVIYCICALFIAYDMKVIYNTLTIYVVREYLVALPKYHWIRNNVLPLCHQILATCVAASCFACDVPMQIAWL